MSKTQNAALVTGATGLLGYGIVEALVQRGQPVRALVRDAERARSILPSGVELAIGDITEPASLKAAVRGVDLVFHAAGMPEQWQRDETVFDRVNRQGTAHVLAASLDAGVRRVVYTSTMDVFAAPRGGTLVETNVDPNLKPTAYERSKQAAEREAEAFEQRGLDIVYLNPGAVYGPSPTPSQAALNGFLLRLMRGQVPLVPPGGMPLAFIDGVVQAHLAAADVGRKSERYLLADKRLSMHEVAKLALAGTGRPTPRTAPAWLLQFLANVSAPLGRLFGFKPLIAPGELSLLLWNVDVNSTKAQRELGYHPTEPKDGIRKTIEAMASRS